jgi:poly(3-hydroxybutyrate) depolymerase
VGRAAKLCLLLWAAGSGAQVVQTGPRVLTFLSDVDGTDQPYALYLPTHFDPARKYPLLISLHGEGSDHRLELRRVFGTGDRPGEVEALASRRLAPLPDVGFIVAAPLTRSGLGYEGIAERDVYETLADVKRRYPVDDDRVYLTGTGVGGGAALRLALTRPDVWAAVAAVAPEPPAGAEELVRNALNVPVHLYHGEVDPIAEVGISRRWQRLLLDADVNVEYVEYPGVRHNAWDWAYRNGAIFAWFAKFRRNPYPEQVRLVTRQYKYDSAYWVRIDGLTPGAPASMDARFTGPDRIEVRTAGLDGFTLNLAGHPLRRAGTVLTIEIDGSRHITKTSGAVSFLRDGDLWKPGRYEPPVGAKRPGLEGPLSDAIASRHIYVYGAGHADAAEVERRANLARSAADWADLRSPMLLKLRAVPDMGVTAADLAGSNLLLFGTAITNSLIARFRDRFPIELNPGAADYGLLFVTPVDGRYVVVCSGLPWPSSMPASRVLAGRGDYILFRGSLGNVLAEGRFDRNWKLPLADAARIQATGAAIIR